MKVRIYSREAMEAILRDGRLNDCAVISFYDPPRRGRSAEHPIDYTGACEHVMQIALHDLDLSALHTVGLTQESYFPEVDELAEFICAAVSGGLTIICQCEYGQSRSAGCAAAILEHFCKSGIDVFADYRYYPNQLVYHKVFDALAKRRSVGQ